MVRVSNCINAASPCRTKDSAVPFDVVLMPNNLIMVLFTKISEKSNKKGEWREGF